MQRVSIKFVSLFQVNSFISRAIFFIYSRILWLKNKSSWNQLLASRSEEKSEASRARRQKKYRGKSWFREEKPNATLGTIGGKTNRTERDQSFTNLLQGEIKNSCESKFSSMLLSPKNCQKYL